MVIGIRIIAASMSIYHLFSYNLSVQKHGRIPSVALCLCEQM